MSNTPGSHAALVGTTASGKSAVALALVREDPTWEIVSIDSMQVYRGMDIGTAKPSASERAEVPHHLLDLVDPHEGFTVVEFRDAYDAVIDDIEKRGRRALLVGGTGLYLRAVIDRLDFPGRYPGVMADLEEEAADVQTLHARLERLDPVAATRMEPTNLRRILRALEVTIGSGRPFSSYGPGLDAHPPAPMPLVGLRLPAETVRRRIAARYEAQMEAGFLAEVATLSERSEGLSRTASQALGYKELLAHVEGTMDLDDALDLAVRRTRRFARRQRSWFRRDPRITWIDADHPDDAAPKVGIAINPLVGTSTGLEDS